MRLFGEGSVFMDKRINIISDSVGKQIVVITDIRFQGKRNINWEEVEKYLKEYIGNCYEVVETADQIFISSDFPGELKGSKDTRRLLGANAKAKANAAQGLPELIEIAAGKKYTENHKEKHMEDAMYGWYRYESRFALPVFNEVGEIERYNVFNVIMVIRHAKDGKMYLYDIMNIKKETSNLFQSEDITQ